MANDITQPLPPGPAAQLPAPSLFDSTSIAAGRRAARFAHVRYLQILTLLARQPMCLFEVAAALSTPSDTVHDHQISGRFTDLRKANLIYRTAEQRTSPRGCKANVYAITTLGLAALAEAQKRATQNPASNPVQTGGEDG